MRNTTLPRLTAQGTQIDTSSGAFGELRRSDTAADDPATLNQRLADDGYLFLPDYLDRDEVLAARRDVLTKMAAEGRLASGTDPFDAIPGSDPRGGPTSLAVLAAESKPLQRLLYTERMISLYERLFAEPVRHFDFTWMRAVEPGRGTPPHMDSVFMNRGTLNLLTAWTPLGDIDTTLGGLAILEGSHQLDHIKNGYGSGDVDTYCSNHEDAEDYASRDRPAKTGQLTDNPVALREQLQLRLLTSDFRAGDLLTFTIFTIHFSLDNNADRLRLSTDSRYQRASEPADERWVGVDPSAHSARSKRGVIC